MEVRTEVSLLILLNHASWLFKENSSFTKDIIAIETSHTGEKQNQLTL